MFHVILKFLLRPVFWVYYRRITLSGLENVPTSGPAILACNHPNSFLDALLVGTYCPRKIHFLARSDVFRSPLAAWLLRQMSMIPVYRLQEGAENLDRNQDTFRRCYEILEQGEVVLIFSEGLCIQEMRLRTLKKGTARIAMEFAKTGASLKIVSVGNNYPNATKFREEYLLGFGVPFDANEYTELYNENNAKAITAFNKTLSEKLSAVVIDIRDKAHEKEYELLVDMLINHHGPALPTLIFTLNDIQEKTVDDRTKVVNELKTYRHELAKYKLRDFAFITEETSSGTYRFLQLATMILPFTHQVPIQLARALTTRTVKSKEFYDSVLLGASMIFGWLWMIILTGVGLAVGPKGLIAILSFHLLTGLISLRLLDEMHLQKLLLNRSKVPDLSKVQQLRRSILSDVATTKI
jgi:1-acyl-sn-glycerol-3-phosphate acyltransferase